MDDNWHRDFGRLEGRVTAIETSVNQIHGRFDRIDQKLDELRLDRARLIGAGWVTRIMFAALGGGGTLAVAKFLRLFA